MTLKLDNAPVVHLNGACIARFVDSAPEIGRHVRGLIFVGFDPASLKVRWTQRIALRDDSDAVDTDSLHPEIAALLAVSTHPGAALPSVEEAA